MKFDSGKFESLQGIEAAHYALDLMKHGAEEEDFLPYFNRNAATMDWPKLELALGILGSVGTSRAFQTIANYLGESNFRLRFVAVKMIGKMPSVDATIMEQVVRSLLKEYGDPMQVGLSDELKEVLKRPANEESQRIAEEYLYGGRT